MSWVDKLQSAVPEPSIVSLILEYSSPTPLTHLYADLMINGPSRYENELFSYNLATWRNKRDHGMLNPGESPELYGLEKRRKTDEQE